MHNKARLRHSDQGETTVTSISEATADPLHNTHILIVDNELGMRHYLISTLSPYCRGVDSIETAQAAEVAALTSIPVPTASPKRPNISPKKGGSAHCRPNLRANMAHSSRRLQTSFCFCPDRGILDTRMAALCICRNCRATAAIFNFPPAPHTSRCC